MANYQSIAIIIVPNYEYNIDDYVKLKGDKLFQKKVLTVPKIDGAALHDNNHIKWTTSATSATSAENNDLGIPSHIKTKLLSHYFCWLKVLTLPDTVDEVMIFGDLLREPEGDGDGDGDIDTYTISKQKARQLKDFVIKEGFYDSNGANGANGGRGQYTLQQLFDRETKSNNTHENNWVLLKNHDHINDDVGRERGDLNQIKKIASEKKCRAFNNLGFLKQTDQLRVQPNFTDLWIAKYKIKPLWNWQDSCFEDLERMKKIYNNWIERAGEHHKSLFFEFLSDSDCREPDYWLLINGKQDMSATIPDISKTFFARLEPLDLYRTMPVGDLETMIKSCKRNLTCNGFTPAFWQTSGTVCSPDINKVDKLSCILSHKFTDPGHKYRVNLLKLLDLKGPKDFCCVFGQANYHNLIRSYKGQTAPRPKEDYIYPYKYYLSVENKQEPFYVTEKFFEPILYGALPFYWGAPNIDDYPIPKEAYILLDKDDFQKSFNIIMNAVANDEWGRRKNAILKAREIILDKTSLMQLLNEAILGV